MHTAKLEMTLNIEAISPKNIIEFFPLSPNADRIHREI